MKRILLICLSLFMIRAGCLFAQNTSNPLREALLCGELYHQPSDVTGYQYFARSWTPGSVFLDNGDTIENQLLNYNGYVDGLIWLNPANHMQVLLEKHFIDGFSLRISENKEHYFRHITASIFPVPDTTDFFAEIMHEGDASLYVFRKMAARGTTVKHIDEKYYSLGSLKSRPLYLLVLPDRRAIAFRQLNRKTFLSVLPLTYREAVKSIMRTHRLALRDENQLTTIVRFLK